VTIREVENLILVGVDHEGSFLVFGDDVPGEDVLPLQLLSEHDRRTLGQAVAQSTGPLNIGAQALQEVREASGLVRFAPETLEQLTSGAQTLGHDGWNLGTLVRDGEFTHSVRWLPVESAGAVSLLAALGPAAALVAVQWQLAQISKLVKKNLALTNQLLHAIRTEQWANVRSHCEVIQEELEHAKAVGAVTEQIWAHAQAQGSAAKLHEHQQQFRDLVQGHLRNLSLLRGARPRNEWLAQNAEALLRDIDSLLIAERGWFCYQMLRAGHLNETSATDTRAATLQENIVDRARTQYARALVTSRPLLHELYRLSRLMEKCPGGVGLKILKRNHAPTEVAKAAEILANQIGTMTGTNTASAAEVSPSWGWLDVPTGRRAISDRLRWILDPTEKLVAVAFATTTDRVLNGYAVFTDRRVMFLKKGAFLKEGIVGREVLWSDVKAVQCSDKRGINGGPDIVLTGINGKEMVQFTRNISSDDVRSLVDSLRQVVLDEGVALAEAAPLDTTHDEINRTQDESGRRSGGTREM
jgi:hypothetical protein